MIKRLDFDYGGMHFYCVVGLDSENTIEEVLHVFVQDSVTVREVPVIDRTAFLETFEDQLNESLEEYFVNLKAYHDDMKWEQAREEGRI